MNPLELFPEVNEMTEVIKEITNDLVSINSSEDSETLSWTEDYEKLLQNLLDNCVLFRNYFQKSYLYYKQLIYYYRIPIIILSSINSVFSVGLAFYIKQQTTSVINCFFSLICACIGSVELFLKINDKIESSLQSYHSYSLLCVKISSILKLEAQHRQCDAKIFVTSILSEYENLIQSSLVTERVLLDKLI